MTPPPQHAAAPSRLEDALARDRLGVRHIGGFLLSGVAPETVAAGVIVLAIIILGPGGILPAFAFMALVLAVFSNGYVAMARHVSNAGAFYAYVARGLGRPLGVGAALLALVAYNMLQTGLYGMAGPFAAGMAATNLHLDEPWWIYALVVWAAVAILGQIRVEHGGLILAVVIALEAAVIVVLSGNGLLHPAPGTHLSLSAFIPHVSWGSFARACVIGGLGYVGFEQGAVYIEEAKQGSVTVRIATYGCLALMAVLYLLAGWAMLTHFGMDSVQGAAGNAGPDLLFQLGGRGPVASAGRVLFLTSLFAAAGAFHNVVTRYMFALGRESVLPKVFSKTSRSGTPRVASAVQSLIGLVVIVAYATAHLDPVSQLFFWFGTTGAFYVIGLVALTALAVIVFFLRERMAARAENIWARMFAPAVSGLVLAAVWWGAWTNYATLLGVSPGHAAAGVLPALAPVMLVVGVFIAIAIRAARPRIYQAIGYGGDIAAPPAEAAPALIGGGR